MNAQPQGGEWWQEYPARDALDEVLAHANEARRLEQRGMDDLSICERLFDSLCQLWTAFRMTCGARDDSDNRAFADMLVSIPDGRAKLLCETSALSDVVHLSPQVMNHDVLRRSSDYRPNQPVPPSLARRAREAHGELQHAYERWKSDRLPNDTAALLKKVAQLLYVVRSNIAHGEKTPYGPDLQKAERDRQVCAVVKPFLWLLVEALLDDPRARLATYGTLIPGGANHDMVSHLKGEWQQGEVEGVLSVLDGLPVMAWKSGAGKVEVWILTSSALGDYWSRLDQFEGSLYHRIVAPVSFRDGTTVVANLYEGIRRDPD